jgi:hypothetical protein
MVNFLENYKLRQPSDFKIFSDGLRSLCSNIDDNEHYEIEEKQSIECTHKAVDTCMKICYLGSSLSPSALGVELVFTENYKEKGLYCDMPFGARLSQPSFLYRYCRYQSVYAFLAQKYFIEFYVTMFN